MKLTIKHQTEYHYAETVRHSTQYLRLTPPNTSRQRILKWELELPKQATMTTDGYGNILHVLSLDTPYDSMLIRASGEVEIKEDADDDIADNISPLSYLRTTKLTQPTASLKKLSENNLRSSASSLDDLKSLMQSVLAEMPYRPGSTDVSYSADEAYRLKSGVCQDHTHVFITCCRHAGLPARYVSGYLYTPDSTHVAMHAWAEVWLTDHWHTFDVTNNTCSPHQHLKLANGMDYLDACPIRGVRFGGGTEGMEAKAAVKLLDELHQQ